MKKPKMKLPGLSWKGALRIVGIAGLLAFNRTIISDISLENRKRSFKKYDQKLEALAADQKKIVTTDADVQKRIYLNKKSNPGELYETDTILSMQNGREQAINNIFNTYYLGETADGQDVFLEQSLSRLARNRNELEDKVTSENTKIAAADKAKAIRPNIKEDIFREIVEVYTYKNNGSNNGYPELIYTSHKKEMKTGTDPLAVVTDKVSYSKPVNRLLKLFKDDGLTMRLAAQVFPDRYPEDSLVVQRVEKNFDSRLNQDNNQKPHTPKTTLNIR